MIEDDLNRTDVENAILRGKIDRKLTKDIRGTRYRIKGTIDDGRVIHIICRFLEDGNLLIITVYV